MIKLNLDALPILPPELLEKIYKETGIMFCKTPMIQAYFFSQDGDGHWYMIPVNKREEWNTLQNVDVDTDEGYVQWQKFADYGVGGSIENIEFTVTNSDII